MTRVALRQVLGRSPEARALVDALAGAIGTSVAIEDADGRPLHGGRAPGHDTRVPVTHGDAGVGWVSGAGGVHAIARLLDHLVARETEKKALGAEVLHLYRELNLIYNFSEKLAALLEVERVAALTLQEARHLIVATDGVVMLLDEETDMLTTVAAFGDEMPALQGAHKGHGIIGAIVASGVGEIVNDVDADARWVTDGTQVRALIAAPLRVGERVTGVIALGSTIPMPYTAAELKLMNTLALQAATAIENARLFERTVQAAAERERLMALHQQTEIARARLESELSFAARIQSALFPAELPVPSGWDIAACNRPARQCGGDYYDVIPCGPAGAGRLLLCVADVSGKGLPAALVMSNTQATLRALLGRDLPLPGLAEQASALLYGSTAPEKYVTAALVDLDPGSGRFGFVSAGHVDTLLFRASGEMVTLSSTGTPLGLLPPGMPYGEAHLSIDPGDTLVLFSDGVSEAQNSDDEEWGEAALVECIRGARGLGCAELIERILAAIDAFAGDASQFDDITILVARRR